MSICAGGLGRPCDTSSILSARSHCTPPLPCCAAGQPMIGGESLSSLTHTHTHSMSSLRRLLLVRTAVAAPGRRSVSGSLVRLALPPSTDPTGQPSSTGPPGHTASPDPWPLPFTEAHLASTTKSTNPDEIELKVDPLDRSYESDLAVTKKRLVYQARKRGMLEGDLLLATFARDHLGQMTAAEVKEFDEVRQPFPFSFLSSLGEGPFLGPKGGALGGRERSVRCGFARGEGLTQG